MEKPYHIMEKGDIGGWAGFLRKNGQALLPMVELIEQSQVAGEPLRTSKLRRLSRPRGRGNTAEA